MFSSIFSITRLQECPRSQHANTWMNAIWPGKAPELVRQGTTIFRFVSPSRGTVGRFARPGGRVFIFVPPLVGGPSAAWAGEGGVCSVLSPHSWGDRRPLQPARGACVL